MQADESGKEKDCETKRPKTSDSDPEVRFSVFVYRIVYNNYLLLEA